MKPNAHGWLSGVRQIASPNFDARPAHTAISLLVIHSISLPPDQFSGAGVQQLFSNQIDPDAHPYYANLRGVKVSAHFFIRRDGELIQFVSCQQRAWHAGVSCWQNRTRCNDFSLGIELEGSDFIAYTDAQYARLSQLTRCLQRHYPLREMVGHADIAPDRKTDPGPFFDWERFRHLL